MDEDEIGAGDAVKTRCDMSEVERRDGMRWILEELVLSVLLPAAWCDSHSRVRTGCGS